MRLNPTGGFATAVSQDATITSTFFPQYSGADHRLAFSTSAGRSLSDQPPVTSQWYQLVGVHDANAGTYALYVNGQAQFTVLHQARGDSSAGPLAVGRALSGGHDSDFWPGTVDQVRVWNRALSAADVTQLTEPGR